MRGQLGLEIVYREGGMACLHRWDAKGVGR